MGDKVWARNGGRFFTWCDVEREVELPPLAWRRLGWEPVSLQVAS